MRWYARAALIATIGFVEVAATLFGIASGICTVIGFIVLAQWLMGLL